MKLKTVMDRVESFEQTIRQRDGELRIMLEEARLLRGEGHKFYEEMKKLHDDLHDDMANLQNVFKELHEGIREIVDQAVHAAIQEILKESKGE